MKKKAYTITVLLTVFLIALPIIASPEEEGPAPKRNRQGQLQDRPGPEAFGDKAPQGPQRGQQLRGKGQGKQLQQNRQGRGGRTMGRGQQAQRFNQFQGRRGMGQGMGRGPQAGPMGFGQGNRGQQMNRFQGPRGQFQGRQGRQGQFGRMQTPQAGRHQGFQGRPQAGLKGPQPGNHGRQMNRFQGINPRQFGKHQNRQGQFGPMQAPRQGFQGRPQADLKGLQKGRGQQQFNRFRGADPRQFQGFQGRRGQLGSPRGPQGLQGFQGRQNQNHPLAGLLRQRLQNRPQLGMRGQGLGINPGFRQQQPQRPYWSPYRN